MTSSIARAMLDICAQKDTRDLEKMRHLHAGWLRRRDKRKARSNDLALVLVSASRKN